MALHTIFSFKLFLRCRGVLRITFSRARWMQLDSGKSFNQRKATKEDFWNKLYSIFLYAAMQTFVSLLISYFNNRCSKQGKPRLKQYADSMQPKSKLKCGQLITLGNTKLPMGPFVHTWKLHIKAHLNIYTIASNTQVSLASFSVIKHNKKDTCHLPFAILPFISDKNNIWLQCFCSPRFANNSRQSLIKWVIKFHQNMVIEALWIDLWSLM